LLPPHRPLRRESCRRLLKNLRPSSRKRLEYYANETNCRHFLTWAHNYLPF
jgi:hypothetical protein